MPSDENKNPFGYALAPGRTSADSPPMFRAADGAWTMELTGGAEGIRVNYERAGGIVRITATALVRHPQGDERQPVTIVLRQEDARRLGPAVTGAVGRIL